MAFPAYIHWVYKIYSWHYLDTLQGCEFWLLCLLAPFFVAFVFFVDHACPPSQVKSGSEFFFAALCENYSDPDFTDSK